LAQFAYNSAKSESTQTSPFFANHGYEPEAYRQPRKDETRAQNAMVLVHKLQGLHRQLATDITFNNQKTAAYANRKRSMGPPLERGDRVYLLRKHIKTKRPSTKLDFKKLGPFEVLEKIGPVNYKLRLPANSRLHPVFHISLLEPAKGETPIAMKTDLQPENDPDVYEVEKILDTRTTTSGQQEYLIKWRGYSQGENSWEPTENLNCPDLLRRFRSKTQGSPRKKAKESQGQWLHQRSPPRPERHPTQRQETKE
jgi:hypothetical protein